MMRVNVTAPIKLMVAVLLGIACIVLIIISLAGTGAFGASGSTALISASTNTNNAIPVVALMLAVALVYWAMDNRR